uniref:Desmoplakin a n=1 Tax=Cyprinus carpio carpio TaxID=630221 RepID=A0A9J8CNH4_CYPCA
ASFGDDAETISQQILNHNKFHSSIQRSLEKMSHARAAQLRDLQNIIEEISRAIIWVNDREEEELVFDWGDKNIDNYIPRKQESYSKLMSDLEEKEKELNKLKAKVDIILKNQHPASDKIEAYMDTLQTQWSWLLQITKCIHIHLKENAAYSQFFKEANETYTRLQKDHESIRKKFICDKNTPLENLTEMLKNLEKEKEKIMESKRQVQTLVSKSKNIVCLKPRNPEEKSSGPVIVKALCDFKQDQKGIMKGNEGILKDNSQRSKWHVTGPGGLEMLIPSVCLLIPPPNPLSISLANKNEQYYEAIMSIWSQLYINIKSLISWQYCMKDIQYINSLTLSMLSRMRPEEYRNIIKNLELHYQEFMRNSLGSEMFSDEDKRKMEMQYVGAQTHYDQLVIQLPSYSKTLFMISIHVMFDFTVIFSLFFSSQGFVCVSRLTALQALLQNLLQAEDIIKVHEARLTEKETSSLDLKEVEKYLMTLKTMKAELEQKKGVLKAMESELSKAVHWNSQIDKSFHQCDVDLSRYSELTGQMTDRWRRIVAQIDSRVWDLEKQEKQLNHYKQTNSIMNKWIQETRQRQDTLQITKFNSLDKNYVVNEQALYSEIKGKKEKVDDVVKDADTCAASIKDYELQLASYSAGLETLLNIPIKRTMLQSPATELRQEAAELQSRYIELLTRSSDYYRFLGEMMKNMEELKTSMIVQRSDANYREIVQERDSLLVKLKLSQQDKDKQQRSEEELRRIKLSLETEIKQKQRLQDEIDKITKDFKYWKSQYELKEGQIRQSEADRDKVHRDKASLQSEIQRLTAELRSLEERYKSRLQSSDKEMSELIMKKEALERELKLLQQRPVPCCRCTQTSQSVSDSSYQKLTVKGLRGEVSLTELVDSNLLDQTDLDKVNRGQLTGKEIEDRLRSYLGGSDCIAGIYDEANDRVLPFYQAMKDGLLRRGTTLELLEAQAASGFIIDPVNNVCMTVDEAWRRALVGKEFKDKLLSAEKAVTGYKDPATGKIISLFQAIEKEIIEKGHGIRLLEAQIASGGIIDPKGSHRIDVEVAYRKGYFDREMNEILTYEGDDTKGFFDPNTHENLTYLQLKKRCINDPKTGLILLPLKDKKKPKQMTSQKNTLRKRRVVIVDPDTGKEMTVREAYHRELIDYDTFLELSEQECEWEEITIETSDGSKRLLIVDRKTGTQYDIQESLDRGVIDRQTLDKYRAGTLTLHEFAGLITSKSSGSELSICTSSPEDVATCSSPTQIAPSSPTIRKRFASVSITLSPPTDIFDDQSPVGAIFDTETLEKITIPEAQRRGIVDNITAQRLLEAQVCTGGIVNPATGQRLSLKDAVQQSIIDEDMSVKLKPAQKAYAGFEDVKTKRKLSAAEAIKEKWLPYEAGQRFLEFQYLTGGLIEPETGRRVSIEEAIRRGWLDGKGAQKLQDTRNYIKNLTCPKTKLKISYKDAMDNCMVEENNGMKMLQATSMSSKGISSPYNVSSGTNSRTGSRAGSRTGSRSGSRRGSVDYTSSVTYSYMSS